MMCRYLNVQFKGQKVKCAGFPNGAVGDETSEWVAVWKLQDGAAVGAQRFVLATLLISFQLKLWRMSIPLIILVQNAADRRPYFVCGWVMRD